MRTSALGALIAAVCVAVSCSSAEQAVVPDVVGTDVRSAYLELRRVGFAVQIDEPFDVTPNHIAYVEHQSIAGGKEASIGSSISLELRPGPYGLLPPGPPALRMPSLIGTSLSEANAMLRKLGLRWTAAPLPPLPPSTKPDLLDNYEVGSQKPKPGRRFVQTITRETVEGTATETTPVWLSAELRSE